MDTGAVPAATLPGCEVDLAGSADFDERPLSVRQAEQFEVRGARM